MASEPASFDQQQAAENERLRFALAAAGVGTWDYNLVSGQAQWSSICKELFGLPPDAEVTATRLLEQVHPDDRQQVAEANAQSLDPSNQQEHNIIFVREILKVHFDGYRLGARRSEMDSRSYALVASSRTLLSRYFPSRKLSKVRLATGLWRLSWTSRCSNGPRS